MLMYVFGWDNETGKFVEALECNTAPIHIGPSTSAGVAMSKENILIIYSIIHSTALIMIIIM